MKINNFGQKMIFFGFTICLMASTIILAAIAGRFFFEEEFFYQDKRCNC
jgi:hypothetical protein